MEESAVRRRKSSSSERFMEWRTTSSLPPRTHNHMHHHHHHHLQNKNRRAENQKVQMGSKAAVVYYLSRSWQLDHPHFIEVPISSNEGLFLRDVISRLRELRGKKMASMYSWSCKRSYKNGFIWHDISEDDLIFPANGVEYVLKGSEILDSSSSDEACRGVGTTTTTRHCQGQQQERCSSPPSPEGSRSRSSSSENIRKGNGEESKVVPTTNASTQTDPPPVPDRSPSPRKPTTLEALILAEQRWTRMETKTARASDVLIQLITCGSKPISTPKAAATIRETDHRRGRRRRQWYSGSLVEMRARPGNGGGGEGAAAALKRSSSHGDSSNKLPWNQVKGLPVNHVSRSAGLATEKEKKKKKKMMTPIPNRRKEGSASLQTRRAPNQPETCLRIEERLISGARVVIQSRPRRGEGGDRTPLAYQ